MYYGTVIPVKTLITSITYWKCKSKDLKDLTPLLSDKEKEEFEKLSNKEDDDILAFLNMLKFTDFFRNYNVYFHILRCRGIQLVFIGESILFPYTDLYNNFSVLWTRHLALLEEYKEPLRTVLAERQEILISNETREKVREGLKLLGLSDYPVEIYFAGEGSGPYSRNEPPLAFSNYSSSKIN